MAVKRFSVVLAGVLCFSLSVRLWADPFTELMESVAATLSSARATLAEVEALMAADAAVDSVAVSAVDTAAVAAVEAAPPPAPVAAPPAAVAVDTVAMAVPVDTASAVADTATVKTAAVDSAAAAAPIAKKPPAPPKPPRTYPISVPNIEMVPVKGGKFTMGCIGESGDCTSDERPRHEVKIGNFLIGKYEVTQKQWASVMGINPAHFEGKGWENLPVEQVGWGEVQEFIRRLNAATGGNYRLPTEAEWEYAALGGQSGKGEKFSGQRFLDDIAWYDYNSDGQTHPVGSKRPNELGLYDMAGNVWEWVGDWFDWYYYRDCRLNNPQGPIFGTARVYRGGSFNSDERNCRTSLRNNAAPGHRTIYLGFRLARSP